MRNGWMKSALVALLTLVISGSVGAKENTDPRQGAVPLPARNGWRAELCIDRGKVGVWTVKAFPIFSAVGTDELVALDDEGQLQILIPYSGRWSGPRVLSDGRWLGGLCQGDLDGSIPGAELYVGGERGDLWQVVPHATGALESRLVAHLDGREIHTLVFGDFDRSHAGPEIVMFTWPGGLYLVRPGDGRLRVEKLTDVDARIRDAVVLPGRDGQPASIATVSRGGVLALLRFEQGKPRFEEVLRVQGGMGRIARRAPRPNAPEVLYTVCDDGCVYRIEATEKGWKPELIYAGPAGMRGVVSGAFDADPGVETIAVFGYSKKVELLTRGADRWRAETIFEDRDKGHWLCTAEVDTRNSTPEIFCCGYGGRVVMLARPAGYGRPGVTAVEATAAKDRPLRLGLAGVARAGQRLSPREYGGGFQLKTLVFETLVGIAADGTLEPRLASHWSREEGGRRWVFTLRAGARFHDGSTCDAEAVAAHFRGWLGHEEHDWLRMNRLVTSVVAVDADHVAFNLKQPFPLPQELVAVNPCAVQAAGARPLGTGPWRVEHYDSRVGARLRHGVDESVLEVAFLHGGDHVSRSHIEAIQSGAVDAVADGWVPRLPRAEALALARDDDEIELVRAPGSRTVLLACNPERVALSTPARRRALAATLHAGQLIEATQSGLARPPRGLFGALSGLPEAVTAGGGSDRTPEIVARHLALPVYEYDPDRIRLAQAVAAEARSGGFRIDVEVLGRHAYLERLKRRDFDLLISGTDGRPYDPWLWLAGRTDGPAWLASRVATGRAEKQPGAIAAALNEIERRLAEDGRWIPLFVPDRIGLVRADRAVLTLGPTPYTLALQRR